MTEEAFRKWLQKRHPEWSVSLVESTCADFLVSARHIVVELSDTEPREEQIQQIASGLRRELVSNVALRDSGVATEQEIIDQYPSP